MTLGLSNYYMTLPTLASVIPSSADRGCVFCGVRDLRICNIIHSLHITCPHCGGRGPLAETAVEALDMYKPKDLA